MRVITSKNFKWCIKLSKIELFKGNEDCVVHIFIYNVKTGLKTNKVTKVVNNIDSR